MRYLRQNTATRVTVGPFLDKTDGITPEVALTVTSCHLTFMVDTGGVPTLILDVAPTASGGSNDMVHVTGDDAGYYDLELAAADVNYVGRASLSINDVATHCPVFHEFEILPPLVYDSLHSTTRALDGALSEGTLTTTDTVVTLWSGHNISVIGSALLVLTGGTDAKGKSRKITYTGSGDDFTVDRPWNEAGEATPTGTITGIIYALPVAPTTPPTVLLDAAGSAALTESYAAVGATVTLPQAIYAILQMLQESSASGTTITVNKRDQVTPAMTFTIDDATDPTSITRAS